MINRIGYACINTSIEKNFKDCRLNSIYTKGIDFLKDIILSNLKLTEDTLLWNVSNNILLYRATSKLIPFSTHQDILRDFSFRWYEDEDILAALYKIKTVVISNSFRLTMHPDQFTVLNSPSEDIVKNAISNLKYHKDLLELMGGSDLIIHTGGVYGDKPSAISRFISTYNSLEEDIKKYLRLENDDVSYTLEDVLSISKECGIPILLDIHHHNCKNNGTFNITKLLPNIIHSWNKTGLIPKCHISSGIESFKDKRHDEFISPSDFYAFCDLVKDTTVDLMVEAKGKEQAVLKLKKLLIF